MSPERIATVWVIPTSIISPSYSIRRCWGMEYHCYWTINEVLFGFTCHCTPNLRPMDKQVEIWGTTPIPTTVIWVMTYGEVSATKPPQKFSGKGGGGRNGRGQGTSEWEYRKHSQIQGRSGGCSGTGRNVSDRPNSHIVGIYTADRGTSGGRCDKPHPTNLRGVMIDRV